LWVDIQSIFLHGDELLIPSYQSLSPPPIPSISSPTLAIPARRAIVAP